MDVKRLAKCSLLTALSLIIFTVEAQIPYPFPIPGIKPGLANIVTVFAVYTLSGKEATLILLSRILIAGLFSGNGMAMIYSLSGGLLCIAGMLILRRVISKDNMWLTSVFGAVLHNTGQLLAAVMITQTAAVLWYAPFLLLSGCLAGAFTGAAAQAVVRRMERK